MEKKVIETYRGFLDELEKGNKRIEVTNELYNWLKENIGYSTSTDTPKGPIGIFHGVEVIKVKGK